MRVRRSGRWRGSAAAHAWQDRPAHPRAQQRGVFGVPVKQAVEMAGDAGEVFLARGQDGGADEDLAQ